MSGISDSAKAAKADGATLKANAFVVVVLVVARDGVVIAALVRIVVAQLLPFSSLLAPSVPGQHPCLKVLHLFFSAGVVIGALVRAGGLVVAQLLPSSSLLSTLVPGQHPCVAVLHLFSAGVVVTQFSPDASRFATSVPGQHPCGVSSHRLEDFVVSRVSE